MPERVPIYKWNREREVALWRFMVRWLLSPFAGFRRRFESSVYYITLLWGVVGKHLSERIATEIGLTVTQEELIWRVPLAIVVVVGLYRFVLFPYEYSEVRVAAVPQPVKSNAPPLPPSPDIELLEISRPRISFWMGAFLHRASGTLCPDRGEALALVFWNRPRSGSPTGTAKNVRARLIFHDKGSTPFNVLVGYWLGGDTVSVDIPPTESRELLIVAVQDPEPLEREKHSVATALSVEVAPIPRKVYAVDARDLLLEGQSTPTYTALAVDVYTVEVQITVDGKIAGDCGLALITKPDQELTISRQFRGASVHA